MILYGEDIGICSYENFNHLLKPHDDKRYSLHLLSFYQEQNLLLLSASA